MMLTLLLFFFFNDTATTEIYTLSLHDALPIFPQPLKQGQPSSLIFNSRARLPASAASARTVPEVLCVVRVCARYRERAGLDRKSTRLNSSHLVISYAVFCLKKKLVTAWKTHAA